MAARAHSVYVPDDTWDALQAHLAETDMSASFFITRAIIEKLGITESNPVNDAIRAHVNEYHKKDR